jgi:hypothetical protein
MSYPLDIDTITSRQLYADRITSLSRSFVGQRIIDEGPESVHKWALSSIETTFANLTLQRVVDLLFVHGITNARREPGVSPGMHDYLVIDCALVADDPTRRWVINLGWDEVMVPQESPEYFIRVTFGAGTEELDSCNPDYNCEWVHVPLTLNATNDDIVNVCEAIVKYIDDNNIELAEKA